MPQIILIIWLGFMASTFPALQSCKVQSIKKNPSSEMDIRLQPGAWRTEDYFTLLQGKTFGVVCNHTATLGVTHLIDTLVRAGLRPSLIFAPEHGFRGDYPDGHQFGNKPDKATGIPIISIYGQNKKPLPEDLADLDFLIFDIQDVGARFYTYLSTLHYVMQACAEENLPLIVLDRPNPNGHYMDGPVLEWEFESFVGLHPVPVVYGMTIGEYAQMINGEGWFEGDVVCDLQVIPLKNYDRNKPYELPERPSPNLPNMRSVYLYPSLCFFEGTPISIGRGTEFPFQLIGHPDLQTGDTWFMPVAKPESTNPPQKNRECRGIDLSGMEPAALYRKSRIDLQWLLLAYQAFPKKEEFFLATGYFDKLAGSDKLRRQILQGDNEEQIRASWKEGLDRFQTVRQKYLLYPDFK